MMCIPVKQRLTACAPPFSKIKRNVIEVVLVVYKYIFNHFVTIYCTVHADKEDKEREVTVRNTLTKVKEVWLADQTTKKAKVTLWREQCSTEFRAGDFIEITDVVTSTYRNETSFSSTSRSTMQVIDAPLTEHQIAVEGISLNGQEVELLTDANEVVTVKLETLRAALPDEVETEDYFCDYSPVRLNVFSRGQNIERLVLL